MNKEQNGTDDHNDKDNNENNSISEDDINDYEDDCHFEKGNNDDIRNIGKDDDFQNNKNYIVANKPKKTRKNNEQKHQLIYRQFK